MVPWLCFYFVYYGIILFLPTIFVKLFPASTTNRKLEYIYLIGEALLEIVFSYLGSFLMNHARVGRKRAVYLGNTLIFLCAVIIVSFGNSSLALLFTLLAIIKIVDSTTSMVKYSLRRFFIFSLLNCMNL
jgi:hypothetical protein